MVVFDVLFFISVIYAGRRIVVFAAFFGAHGGFVFYFVAAVGSFAKRYLAALFIGLLCASGVFFDVRTLARLIKLPELLARGINLFRIAT